MAAAAVRKPRPVAAAPSDESHCFLQSPSLQSSPGSGNMKLQSGTPHCCSAAAFRPHLAMAVSGFRGFNEARALEKDSDEGGDDTRHVGWARGVI